MGSEFFRYFGNKFDFLQLKKLITTSYNDKEKTKKWVVDKTLDLNKDGKINMEDAVESTLKQNGSFSSDESIEILKQCDVVVTNPPFSLFRKYLDLLIKHNKKFLIIGNMNAITYKETFKLIKEGKVWLGNHSPKQFYQPNGSIKNFGNVVWFTNLDHAKRHDTIDLYENYTEDKYPKYDNYDAIEVSKVVNIPKDYPGVMGVPISYLGKHNPNQFEIIGHIGSVGYDGVYSFANAIHINGNKKFKRILIKRK